MKKLSVMGLYELLYAHFGPRSWWPAESPFEVVVGAILTQNTAWTNVERAMAELKKNHWLDPRAIRELNIKKLEKVIFSAGFYRQKARRLKHFSDYLLKKYDGELDNLFSKPLDQVRDELLRLNGIGDETADSILLYAGNKLVFVIDAYTRRLLKRLGLTDKTNYADIQDFFTSALPEDVRIYNEYHALIVEFSKSICKKVPECTGCFLENYCEFARTNGIK